MEVLMIILMISLFVLYIGMAFVVYIHQKMHKTNAKMWLEHYKVRHGANLEELDE